MNDTLYDIYELIKKAKNGDRAALDKVVENNLGLVGSIIKKFSGRGYDAEELFQIGSIGLIKAVQKFDLGFGVKFSTYAVPMIIGEIKRFLRDDGIIKVSRSIKELSGKIRYTKEVILKESGKEPTVSEMAERLKVSQEDIVIAMESLYTPESLYSPVMDDDQSSLMVIDKIDDESSNKENDIVDRLALRQVMENLNPEERQIITLRYFREMTQSQIAAILGISQVQVSRMEKKIIREMRKRISV